MSPGRGLDMEPISYCTSSRTDDKCRDLRHLKSASLEAVLNYFFAAAFLAGAFFVAFLATSV